MRKISKKNVLAELAAIAFSDFTDFVSVETLSEPDQVLTVTDTAALSRDCRRAVASIKAGTKGIEVKLHDKLRALELLGKVTGALSPEDNAEQAAVDRLRSLFETGDDFASD